MAVDRRTAAFLDLAAADLDAAELLARIGNHYAAYHVQQAIEKLLKAVLLVRGIEAGIEHRLDVLVEQLPADDAWRARVEPLLDYSVYATAYRYPMPGGRIPPAPRAVDVLRDVATARDLLGQARVGLARGGGP